MAQTTEIYLRCYENQKYLRITNDGVTGIEEQNKDEFAKIKIISAGDSVRLLGKKSGKYVGVKGGMVESVGDEDEYQSNCTFIKESDGSKFKLKTQLPPDKYLVLSGGSVSVATELNDASDGAEPSNETGQLIVDPANIRGNHWEEIQS